MDILNQVIALMGRKEVKNFKIYAGRAFIGEQRKDLMLFDFIREKGENYTDDDAFKKLYQGENKNAFYRIKNRLLDDINTGIFLQEYGDNDIMLAFFWTALGFYYQGKNQNKPALFHFKKAEKKALHIENYGLLDIIYARLIRISQEVYNENPEKYLEKRKHNRSLFNKMSDLDDILEAAEYRMKVSQNLSTSDSVQELLKITIDDYTTDEELKDSPKLQIKLYQVVSRILAQKQDYISLENYLIETFESLTEKHFFNKANHSIKLDMISWIANTLFANKKYKPSLEYAENLHTEMEKFDNAFYDRFEFFYYNILVINYSAINPEKAIEILLDLTQKSKMKKISGNGVFVYLNLSLLYYHKRDFKNALKYITKLYSFEGYTATDALFKLRINLGELMMRFDTGEKDIMEYRLKQVDKFMATLPKDIKHTWEKNFAEVLSLMANEPNYLKHQGFKDKVKKALKVLDDEQAGQSFLFDYGKWLKEKAKMGN
ncbi:MAG: hypothetical protein NTX03_10955 [Bacteroidetes bacterium]|nr:hypothetical protein [Bacteroidota bacterium]